MPTLHELYTDIDYAIALLLLAFAAPELFMSQRNLLRGRILAVAWFAAMLLICVYAVLALAGRAPDFASVAPVLLTAHPFFTVLIYAAVKAHNANKIADKHVRGAQVNNTLAVREMRSAGKSRFKIGDVPIPINYETVSFMMTGAPGTGKSQVIKGIMQAIKDDSSGICVDVSGLFYSQFASPGDILLNPHDARTQIWSPLAEIKDPAQDCALIAKGLIPDAAGEAATWSKSAQIFVESILQYLHNKGDATNGDIRKLVLMPMQELAEVLAETKAAMFLNAGNERFFESVRSSAIDALSAIEHYDPRAGHTSFSVRRFISDAANAKRWLFITYQQPQLPSLRAAIATQIDIAIRELLSLTEDLNRRIVFVLDEVPLLGKINGLQELITNGRKYGAVPILGIQSIAQLRDVYSRDKAETIVSSISTHAIFRCNDADSAEYMSRLIGEAEISRCDFNSSESAGVALASDRVTSGYTRKIIKERAVMPAQLQALPNLHAIVKLPACSAVAYTQIPIVRAQQLQVPFVPREQQKLQVSEQALAIQNGAGEANSGETQSESQAQQSRAKSVARVE
jgi:type IV secretory pathway TraG/TraD family ATPase VirD4/uncharacterized membrane protein